jgi:hypothetical protein
MSRPIEVHMDTPTKIARNTGRDPDNSERAEIEHFGNCPFCGALVDVRDLGRVIEHAHGQEVEEIDAEPLNS